MHYGTFSELFSVDLESFAKLKCINTVYIIFFIYLMGGVVAVVSKIKKKCFKQKDDLKVEYVTRN